MNPLWLTAIVSLLGILSTITAWFFNPRRKSYAEIDQIFTNLNELYNQRDAALVNKDSNALTATVNEIGILMRRKNELLTRIGIYDLDT